jgi:subtilase family serine protease
MEPSKKSWRGRSLVVGVVLLMVVSAFAVAVVVAVPSALSAPASTTTETSYVTVTGPLEQVAAQSNLNPHGATPLGKLTVFSDGKAYRGTAPMSVSVDFTPTASLSNYLNNPASLGYRSFLSASQVGSEFGASAANYAAATAYFTNFGLRVTPSSTDLGMTLSGTVAEMAAAFHTQFAAFHEQYKSSGSWNPRFGDASGTAGSTTWGPVFYSNIAGASLPLSLQKTVSGIVGLDGMYATPNLVLPSGLSPASTARAAVPAANADPINVSTIQSIKGANYTWTNLTGTVYCEFDNLCGDYQFLWPATMHVLTGAEGLWDGSAALHGLADEGQGVTIALVEVGCVLPSDVTNFSKMAFGSPTQLPDRFTQLALNGSPAIVPNNNLTNCITNGLDWGWTGESSLDLEYASTMAPLAHIDLIGLPTPFFSQFDSSYLAIAQYLATGKACNLAGSGFFVVEGNAHRACSVSIDSNSYGAGEQSVYFFGAPMYISLEDEDLEALNLVGVTNLFSSGDGGSFGTAASASIPAVSPGATSVGGGQLTAFGKGGKEFPSGPKFCFGVLSGKTCSVFNMTVAHAQGVASFTYWSYDGGLTGTFQGAIGGGFGASVSEPQPWWQNGLDTYSTGTQISPVISGTADFNMTFYFDGFWNVFYGGTSFACPIAAASLALIEEQANLVLGSPKLGDVNPILFQAHNAHQAGVPVAGANAYLPMTNIGVAPLYAPSNNYAEYLFNLSINEPSDPILPSWYATLSNPAGPGWNLLQGLGMPRVAQLDNVWLGGPSGSPRGLLDPTLVVLEQSGGLAQPFTTLTGGTSYTFEVARTGGGLSSGDRILAYSGGTNTGTYGGGTVTVITTSSGQFTYTPTYATPSFPSGAPEYGYFYVQNLSHPKQVDFQAFAVTPAAATGSLKLCVTDAEGTCQHASAEVPMFTTVLTGFYNLYGSSTVTLQGLPVANAVVHQEVLVSQFGLSDPTIPPSSYAPGTVVGQTMTDARGNGLFWTAPLGLAEVDGELVTQVYVLWATYEGLTSNKVVVFVEPQSGNFANNLQVTDGGKYVSGTVDFLDMKYVNWVNVSVGDHPGQYSNTSYPSGQVYNGQVHVNLLAPSHGPIVVAITAEGQNNVGYILCFQESGTTTCFSFTGVQNPMYWQDPTVLARGS